jgi:hypothetical protein
MAETGESSCETFPMGIVGRDVPFVSLEEGSVFRGGLLVYFG